MLPLRMRLDSPCVIATGILIGQAGGTGYRSYRECRFHATRSLICCGLSSCRHQGLFHRRMGVDGHGIEGREGDICRLNEQRYLSAAKNNALDAILTGHALDDGEEAGLGRGAKAVVDY